MSRPSIAYCIDGSYPMPLAVSLRSVLESWRGGPLDVYVLEGNVSGADKARVASSLPRVPGVTLRWLPADPGRLQGLEAGLHFSPANFFRLLLPDALSHVDRLLYLDADTVARADTSALLDLFDDRLPLQACRDYCGTIANPLIRLPGYAELGMTADTTYFNSGVLLMNLRTWREERIAEEVIDLGRRRPEAMFLADQTLINVVLRGRIGMLPAEWNAQTVHPRVSDGSWNIPFVPQDLEGAKLVHYTSEYKPWSLGRDLPAAAHFQEVLARTDWAHSGPRR